MKKLFMILLVFVCSIVLCVSVFAVEAQACDDGCEAEAVQQEEVAETASASLGTPCAHDNYYNYLEAIESTYYGPTQCGVEIWQVVRCRTCGSLWYDSLLNSYITSHIWDNHQHVRDDGSVVNCEYCERCDYHSRG